MSSGPVLNVDISAFFLLQPLGFQVDDTKLKRAGLDYWPYPALCFELKDFSDIIFLYKISFNLLVSSRNP